MAKLAYSIAPVKPYGAPTTDASSLPLRASRYVFCTTMLGNFAEKSAAFCATKIAVLRAISR
jgi:hypothetical protein